MTSRSRAAVAAFAIVAVGAAVGPTTSPKKRVRSYAAPAPLIEPVCYLAEAAGPTASIATTPTVSVPALDDVGGACIGIGQNDRVVTVTLTDDAGWRVSGTAYFRDRSGSYIDDAQYGFCETRQIDIPADARHLIVAAEASNVWCLAREGESADSGPATSGTITATFLAE